MLHHHSRQQTNTSLRELMNQFVNTLKHPFDSNKPSIQQQEEEVSNAKLSQFEKTYVSFPEFVDITAVTANENNNNPTTKPSPLPLYSHNKQQSLAY